MNFRGLCTSLLTSSEAILLLFSRHEMNTGVCCVFLFFFAPQKLPDLWCCRAAWTLVGVEVYAAGGRAGEGWEVDRDEERHLNLINPLFFFSHPLGQCQQLEEPGKSERCELWEQPTPTGEGEKKKFKKEASVYITAKVSVCIISYKSARLPKGKEKSVPRLLSELLKRTSPVVITVNIMLSYLSEYYELMFYWGVSYSQLALGWSSLQVCWRGKS